MESELVKELKKAMGYVTLAHNCQSCVHYYSKDEKIDMCKYNKIEHIKINIDGVCDKHTLSYFR